MVCSVHNAVLFPTVGTVHGVVAVQFCFTHPTLRCFFFPVNHRAISGHVKINGFVFVSMLCGEMFRTQGTLDSKSSAAALLSRRTVMMRSLSVGFAQCLLAMLAMKREKILERTNVASFADILELGHSLN